MEMKKMKVIFLAITIVPLLVQPMRQIGKKQIQKIAPTALSAFTPSLSTTTSHLTTPARHTSYSSTTEPYSSTNVPSSDQLASFIPITEPQAIVGTSDELLLPAAQAISIEPDTDAITASIITDEAPIIDLAKHTPSQQLFTSQQISSILQQQPISLQKILSNHPFYTDFLQEAQNHTLNDTSLLKKEIYLYILQHPENALDIMDFYQEIKNEQILIKERLKKLPPLTQTFFEKQLQKYKNIQFSYDAKEKNYIKTKICKAFPYVIAATAVTVSILGVILYFIIAMDLQASCPEIDQSNEENKDILEIFHLLIDALNLDPIPLRRIDSSLMSFYALYMPLPLFKSIIFSNRFFSFPLETQILVLLHELKHYLQANSIVIDKETIEYAKSLQVQPYSFDIINFLTTGFFWSNAMLEFDADLFATKQMKEHKAFQSAVKALRHPTETFDPTTGYLSRELMLKQADNQLPNLQEQWTDFIKELPNENIYLEYVPAHLIKAAQKNRFARKEKESARKAAQEQYQAYLEE
ncbi:hypothetical protein HYV11_01975 [Candidatus Dependentiae bacterium]|nr:hypothetical protein [Candidatus Dependentiae bacterium]